MKNLTHIIILITLCFCTIPSCNKETIRTGTIEEKGTLFFSHGTIALDHNITTIGTKAAPHPSIGDFTMILTPSSDGTTYTGPATPGQYILLEDSYKLELTYGTNYLKESNAPFSTTPFYYGSTNFAITAGAITNISLGAKFCGSIITVIMPQDLINHYKTYQIKVAGGNGTSAFETITTPGAQLFLRPNIPVIITLEGTNQVNETKTVQLFNSASLTNGVIADNTEYKISATMGNIPTITLPSQADYNSWATKHIISPATLSSGNASSLIYEAIPSSSNNWDNPIIANNSNPIFTFPPSEASITYKMRARYGIITSNECTFTPERAQQIPNSTFETTTWNSVNKGDLWSSGGGSIYNYSYPGWTTNNSPYADAPSSEYKVLWKWASLVEPDNETVLISTKGFATKKLGWADVGVTYVSKIQSSFDSNPIIGNGEFKTDFLSFEARPNSISFQYKYISYPATGDNCIIYMNIYNENKELIATTNIYSGADQAAFNYITLPIYYNPTYSTSKAKYISAYFKSGSKAGNTAAKYVQGSYDASPHGKSQFLGSQLWIDNITINY